MDRYTIKFQGFNDTERSYLIVTDEAYIDAKGHNNEEVNLILKGIEAEKYFEKILNIINEIEEKT